MSAETRSAPRRVYAAGRSHFVPATRCLPLLLRCSDQLRVRGIEWRGQIHHHQRQIGVGHGLIAALDAQLLFSTTSWPCANARRVDETCTGMPSIAAVSETRSRVVPAIVGDDGAVLFEQPVEQTALADVRAADNGQRESVCTSLP